MTMSSDLRALATAELYAWLHLAQEDLHEARNVSDELEAEAMCDTIVSELLARDVLTGGCR